MKAKEKILAAAIELFEVYGYVGTTTASIAEKAGVAEVTIFKNFKNKQNLFSVVVEQISLESNFNKFKDMLSGDVYSDLELIAENVMSYFVQKNQTIRMLMFEAIKNQEVENVLFEIPQKLTQLLGDYFEQQMAKGIVQKKDPVFMAKSFLSLLIGYSVFITPLTKVAEEKSIKEVSISIVDTFLNGVVLK